MTNIDLHVHTPASPCASWSSYLAWVKAIQDTGLDYICVTDHGTIDGYLHLIEHHPEIREKVFPGIELTTPSHGDLLVYSEDLNFLGSFERNYNLNDLIIRLQGKEDIAVVWAHPAYNSFYGSHNHIEQIPEIAPYLDGVEVMNGTRLDETAVNKDFADEVKRCKSKSVCRVAGSDAHAASILGRAYTEFDDVRSIADMIRAIKQGEAKPVTR